ncbi:MAG: homoserine kinase [Gemmatimonadales bacterium]|nr:homoserine kinase [Gemmatimonadales bacterium]
MSAHRERAGGVSAFAPATVANLGPGFDVLGLALAGPGDTVTARFAAERGVRIVSITGDGGALPADAQRNTAGIAAARTLERAGVAVGVELEIAKGLPIGSGLGSSAASAAAAALAVNVLVGSPLRKTELIAPCVEAEAAVAGRHADNVAPALLGGLILIRSIDPLDLIRLPIPQGLTVAVVTPRHVVDTRAARAALPRDVPLPQMVLGTANLAAFASACFSGDLALLARCMTDDVVTSARAHLIPGCADVIAAALKAGALGSSISGSGPSIFALCHSERMAADAARAMSEAFLRAGLESSTVLSPADCPGAREL